MDTEQTKSQPQIRPEILKAWNEGLNSGLSGSAEEDVQTSSRNKPNEPLLGHSLLSNILDVLQSGEYASALAAQDYITGKPFDIDKYKTEFMKRENKVTYDEIVDKTFPDMGPWKRKALGFSLSIFADPTTYIPLGAIGKTAGKGIEKGGQLLLEKTPIGKSALAKAFIPSAGIPKDLYEMEYYASKALQSDHEYILKDINELQKGLSKDDMAKLSYLREHPDEVVPERLAGKLEAMAERFDGLIDEAVKGGVITEETAIKWRMKETPYVPHYYPERGINIAKGELPPSLFEKAKKPSFLKQRSFETMEDAKLVSSQFDEIANAKTIEEARQKITDFGFEDAFGKGQVLDFETMKGYAKTQAKYYTPDENILRAYGIRAYEQANYIQRTKFVENVLDNFGTKVDSSTKVLPEGYGIYKPKGAIRFYAKEMLDPKFIDDLKDIADQLQNLSKTTVASTTKKTTTETTITGGAALAGAGPVAKMENVVREALQSRGFNSNEADVYIRKIKANGSGATDDIIKKVEEKIETVNTILDSKKIEGDLVDLAKLSDAEKQMVVGLTTRVPTYMLDEGIAKHMNKFGSLFIGDEATNKLLGVFDTVQNAWKKFATTVRLPFHLRNAYSNWWQSYLGGVDAAMLPTRIGQAAGIQSGALKELTLGGKKYSVDELKLAIDKLGIHGKGWVGSDIPKQYINELESIVKYGSWKKANPFELGTKFGIMVEDNARIGLFIDQIDKGKTFKEASQQVRKYLFDYTELTPFEKNVMRRVMPFYTWSRKDIPLQIESLLTKPKKYQRYGKGLQAFKEDETPEETKFRPEYFDEMMYVKSPFRSEKDKPIYMSLDLPPLDINRMVSVRSWLSSLSPIKLFAEIGLNIKAFPAISKISEQPLEKTRAPFWTAWLPEKVISTMKDNRIIDTIIDKRTGKKVLGIDKEWLHGINTAFPFLNELSRIEDTPVNMDDESPEMKKRGYLSGIGHSVLDTKRGRENDAYGKLKVIDTVKHFSIQHGRPPNKNEMEELDPKGFIKDIFSGVQNKPTPNIEGQQ